MDVNPTIRKINQLIDSLQSKCAYLEEQYNYLLNENQIMKEEINELKTTTTNIYGTINKKGEILKQSTFSTTNPLLNNKKYSSLKSITNHFEISQIHDEGRVNCILELSDKRIVTGSEDGSLTICAVDYSSKNFIPLIIQNKAHDRWINCICELVGKRLVSCSWDATIKVWDVSAYKELILLNILKEHTSKVNQVIPLTNNIFASCSSYDGTVKLWKDITFVKLSIPFEKQNGPSSLLFTKQNILVISCRGDNCLKLYEITSPYSIKGEIKGVCTSNIHGMVELKNNNIAISKGNGNIYIIDPINYFEVAIIRDPEYIINGYCGSLCVLYDSFIYVCRGCLCFISINKNNSVIFRTKDDLNELFGSGGIVPVENGQYLLVDTDNSKRGINVYKFEY